MLGITGGMPSTPTSALEMLTGLLPLSIQVEMEALMTADRFKRCGIEPRNVLQLTTGHRRVWRALRGIPETRLPSDYVRPVLKFDRKFRAIIPERETWARKQVKDPPNMVNIYTDGSRCRENENSPMSTGAGIYCDEMLLQHSIPLGEYATVFQAEVYAIGKAARMIMEEPEMGFIINSDSQAAIMALMKPRISSRTVLEAWESLNERAQRGKVLLRWIPGHSNLLGNEEADSLAKAGAQQTYTAEELTVGVAPAVSKLAIKCRAKRAHIQLWNELGGCRQAKHFIGENIGAAQVKMLLDLPRWKARLLTGILTGHNGLNRHLSLMKLKDHSNCPNCLYEETTEHYLCYCPAYFLLRQKLFGEMTITIEEAGKLSWSVIMSFILKSKRFD